MSESTSTQVSNNEIGQALRDQLTNEFFEYLRGIPEIEIIEDELKICPTELNSSEFPSSSKKYKVDAMTRFLDGIYALISKVTKSTNNDQSKLQILIIKDKNNDIVSECSAIAVHTIRLPPFEGYLFAKDVNFS